MSTTHVARLFRSYLFRTALLGSALSGCGAPAADPTVPTDPADVAAESAVVDEKADGLALQGHYALPAEATRRAGDLTDVSFAADGHYVRARCYHAGCGELVPETDSFDTVRTSGKTYVRFYSFKIVPNASSGERDQVPVVVDMYEYKRSAGKLRLRKTYTTRWIALDVANDRALCEGGGGTWSDHGAPGASCACAPISDPGAPSWVGTAYVIGAGCIEQVDGGESACDDTNGFYTDDDARAIGGYCSCGVGRRNSNAGCVPI